MSQEKVIDAAGLPLATGIDNSDAVVLASGKRIQKAALSDAILGNINMNLIMDNVFIMYHRKSDDFPLMVKPHKWTSPTERRRDSRRRGSRRGR